MDPSDASFIVGVFIAPLVTVLAFPAVIATRRSAKAVALASALSAVVVGCLIAYWYLWGVAFDAVDGGREVPASVDRAIDVAVGVSAVSTVLLTALCLILLVTSRRRSPTPSASRRSAA